MYGLANMTLFLILINYIAAVIAVQLLRGDVSQGVTMNFGQLYTSFLAMYQVFSSENWTTILYGVATAETKLQQTVIVVLFVTIWMVFANCELRISLPLPLYSFDWFSPVILLQMFIAVINENFDVAEEAKRGEQANHFWQKQQVKAAASSKWMRKLNPYRCPVRLLIKECPY